MIVAPKLRSRIGGPPVRPRARISAGSSALPAVIARRQVRFTAEHLGEMAGARKSEVEGDGNDALIRFPQEPPRGVHACSELILGWRHAGGLGEQAMEMKF